MSAGRGWIAVVAVMLGRNNPLYAGAACVLFGFADAIGVNLQSWVSPISSRTLRPMSRLCLRSSSLIATKFAPRNDQYNRWGQRWKTKTGEWDRLAHHHLAIALDAVACCDG